MDAKALEALGAVLNEFSCSHTRKVVDDVFGSRGHFFSLTLQVAPGTDIDALATAAELYCKQRVDAQFTALEHGDMKANAAALFPKAVTADGQPVDMAAYQAKYDAVLATHLKGDTPFVPGEKPEPHNVPDGNGEQEVTEFPVAKYTIAIRPDGKHQLQLFPRIKDEPGKYPEVTFVGDEGATAEMISAVVQDVPKVPSQGLVAWTGFYKLGREYVSSKDQKVRRYKDLIAIREA